MNKLQLLEQRSELIENLKSILNSAKSQKRELLKVEDEEFRTIQEKINQIDNKIENKTENKNKIMEKNLFRNIQKSLKGDDSQNELKNEIRKSGGKVDDNAYIINVRAVSPTGGDTLIPTQVMDVSPILSEDGVIAKSGGHVVSVPAEVTIPSLNGGSLQWIDCGIDTTNDNFTISGIELKLNRLAGSFSMCKELTKVTSPTLEAAVETSIYKLVDAKLNEKLFDSFSGVTNVTGATSYDAIIAAKGALLATNVNEDNIVMYYNPADLSKLVAKGKKANEILEPILSDTKTINGNKAFASNFVPAGTVYVVDGSAIWANVAYISVLLDPYTESSRGNDRFVVNAFADAAINLTFVTAATLV